MGGNVVRWIYVLDQNVTWESGHAFPGDLTLLDREGTPRVEVTRTGRITVLARYAWDGCTPKRPFLDLVFGIPDGAVDRRTRRPKTYYASLIHDAMYQFLDDGLGLRRHEADRFFLRLMSYTDFFWRHVYFAAVWAFGGLFRGIGKRIRGTRGRAVPRGDPSPEGTRVGPLGAA